VPVELVCEERDKSAHHFLAMLGDEPVGAARLLPSGQIGRMAVLAAYRNQGIGHKLLKACEKKLTDLGIESSFLHAQTHAISFYEKAGYRIKGDEFLDAGIPHRTMYK
jgi:predicted GNAT family N-acyltransferase